MGYVEPDPLPAGSIALVTHSGSVFSALLRTRRAFGFTLAVSSGQELVTSAPSYLEYALAQPETKVLALVLEAIREPDKLRSVLDVAAGRDLPVILLTAGQTEAGRAMVAAHSGALAGSGAGWEALVRHYGIHRVSDLAELADTAELFSLLTKSGRLVKTAPAAGRGSAGPGGRPPVTPRRVRQRVRRLCHSLSSVLADREPSAPSAEVPSCRVLPGVVSPMAASNVAP
jgi:acetate---CoA ligase (ADP-forming)